MHLKTAKECDTETLCVGQHEITCDICKFKCDTGDDFKTHFVEEHEVKGGESYDCSLCNNFKAPSVQKLIKHLKSHYKCTYCDKNFQGISSIRNLKRHMRQTHLNPAYRPPNPETSHSNESSELLEHPKKRKIEYCHSCLYCAKTFPILSGLKRHMKTCSINTSGNYSIL